MQGCDESVEIQRRCQAELSLIEVIAGQVARAVGATVDFDDLLSAGREGLFDAARKYDASRGIPFRAYANFRIKGAMIDGVRKQARLPRRAHERLSALSASVEQSHGELSTAFAPGRPSLSEGDAEARLATHLANMATAAAVGSVGSSDVPGLAESADDSQSPEQQLEQAELMDLVRRTINEMSPDEAGVVQAFYFEGKSMGEIAVQHNISKSWVSRLHAQAIGRLTRRIKGVV